jgi:hypothetical protein
MFHNVGKLTTGELAGAETACQLLIALHRERDALDNDFYVEVSTVLADIHAEQEDRAAAEARHKIALAAQAANKVQQ